MLDGNWYKELIQHRTKHKYMKGIDLTHGQEKSLDEKFHQDIELWYKLPIWEVQRFINCIALDKPLVHDM